MIKILKNYNLTNLNTFHIKAIARFFVEIKSEQDLKELLETLEFQENEKLFLGGGSNVLFTKDFEGIVILNKLKGIKILETPTPSGVGVSINSVEKDSDFIFIKSMSGELWNDLVLFTIRRELWGIENLSLIPGTVGAAPIQNIGAYGVELKDILESVEAYEIETGQKKFFSCAECEFEYRDSVFKNKFKGQYFISAITLKLSKKEDIKIGYKILQEYLDKNKIEVKKVEDISNAVSEIRRSKLPDPKIIGNAGSFFKNVFVSEEELKNLLEKYPDATFFKEEKITKIPAGWLIEQCGWKGKRIGNVGVHDKQALVLVNHGGATGEEMKNLAFQIIDSVYQKFGLRLTPEVNLI